MLHHQKGQIAPTLNLSSRSVGFQRYVLLCSEYVLHCCYQGACVLILSCTKHCPTWWMSPCRGHGATPDPGLMVVVRRRLWIAAPRRRTTIWIWTYFTGAEAFSRSSNILPFISFWSNHWCQPPTRPDCPGRGGADCTALYDLARQLDGDALRLNVLGGVLLLAAHLRRWRNAHLMPPHVYSWTESVSPVIQSSHELHFLWKK